MSIKISLKVAEKSESIEQDDQRFCEMMVKQHPDGPPIYQGDDSIEKDDVKLDELLTLQSISEPLPEPSSIEEKYEEELVFEQIAELINDRLAAKEDVEQVIEEMEEENKGE
jgi:hypothetical protein